MELAQFANRLKQIEEEASDLLIRQHIVDIFNDENIDIKIVVRFLLGRIFPTWDNRKMDIGPSLCYNAIASAASSDVTIEDIENSLANLGEIGLVAEEYNSGAQRGLFSFGIEESKSMTLDELYSNLYTIAALEGSGSLEKKRRVLSNLFNLCGPLEARYISRLVLSEMRIGVGEGAIRDAISAAFDIPVVDVERALQISNDFGFVAEISRERGIEGVQEIKLKIGRPISSMLAQASTIEEALSTWEVISVEPKYDGARIQAHYDGESVLLYSRNMEEVTKPLPEIVDFIKNNLSKPAILDGEVIAADANGNSLPFQEVLRRFRRKHNIEKARKEVLLRPYFFDCVHVDGVDLLDSPLTSRREWLDSILQEGSSPLILTKDPSEIRKIESRYLEEGFEGIMLKNPDSLYAPGKRGKNWMKCKPGVETIDCVITGAEWGKGRRANFLGAFELSIVSKGVESNSKYKNIGRVGTGITDAELEEMTELLRPHIENQTGKSVTLTPEIVLEVGYEEIQKSSNYSSGYALRFPRVIGIRHDKKPNDADTLDRVERLYTKFK
tara:strand:- start:4869 stop:6536 length:1668 start_codon:yes stop_codon:yes gene_type:complete